MAVLARRLVSTLFCSAFWPLSAATSTGLDCAASSDLLGEAVRAFDRTFYSELAREERGNLFYSPLGLHVLLAQAYFGSPGESTTAKELEKLLGFSTGDLGDYLCKISRALDGLAAASKDVGLANRVFVAGNLVTKSPFESTLATHFKSGLQRVDFHRSGAASVINGFASDQTRGLIKNIVEEEDLGPFTRMVFVSAIFFKGSWNVAFPKAATTRELFQLGNDLHHHTAYEAMHLKADLQHFNVTEIEAEVLRIPYASEQFEMVVVLPYAGSNITRVESKVGKSNVVFNVFESSDAFSDVTLSLPKFEVNVDVSNAVEVLEALGVRSMFQDGFADFSNISDEPLSVSKLVHKAVVRVDEDGTEAAAASSAILIFKSALPQPLPKIKFTVDRPFLFFIYDNVARVPIFKGRIVDPTGQSKLKF